MKNRKKVQPTGQKGVHTEVTEYEHRDYRGNWIYSPDISHLGDLCE